VTRRHGIEHRNQVGTFAMQDLGGPSHQHVARVHRFGQEVAKRDQGDLDRHPRGAVWVGPG
jgi:hypothetical protein